MTLSRREMLAASASAAIFVADVSAQSRPDAGTYHWKTVPFGGGGFVSGFAYHPRAQGLLYARTDVGGAFRWDLVTRRWLPLLDHLGRGEADLMGVVSLALDPSDPDLLYLACGQYLAEWAADGAVLRSNDRGRSWSKTTLGFKLGGNADGRGCGERLQVDPNLAEILFLGTNQDGLRRSADRGANFTRVSGFPDTNVTLVLFDAASGVAGKPTPRLFAGSGQGGLYRSEDGGRSFELVPGSPRAIPQRAVLDGKGNLYVTFSDGLAPKGGKSGSLHHWDPRTGDWKDISPMRPGGQNPGFAYCGVDVDRNRPGTIVVSTMNRWALHDDIYVSRDDGSTWQAIGANARHDPGQYHWLAAYLNGHDRMGHWIADVRIDPFDSNALIYGTGYGLWMSRNLGAVDAKGRVDFSFEVENLEETAALDMVSPSGGATILVAMADVGGSAYDNLHKSPQRGLFLPTSQTNRSVASAELAPRFAVRTSDAAPTGGFISDDGCASWKPFGVSPRKSRDDKGTTNAGRVAISANGTSLVWAPERHGGLHSQDHGATWAPCLGWPASDRQLVPVADRAIDKVFYVYDRAAAILTSVDGGASFAPTIQGIPKIEGWQSAQLVATPGRIRDLWFAGPWGLLHTSGPSETLRSIRDVNEAWLVALGKAPPGRTYPAVFLWGKVKGVEGLWRSDDQGGKWTRVNGEGQRFGALRCMAADPLEYGTLYIGPHGRGIVRGAIGNGAPA